jgi:two-component system nitrogen regulation response regulator GlnG
LRVSSERGGLKISAIDEADCRIGLAETEQTWLSDDALRKGVAIRLGHAVVLFLREVALPPQRPEITADAYPGCSVETQTVRQLIATAAGSEVPVLILGESGVGKELVAKAIHAHGQRRQRPWQAVNMAALPETIAAAELFGSAKGAYTGAQARAGLFQAAHRSTLFLDEIGDTPPQVQAQLLRTLQEREVRVLGGAVVPVDVRVIAATDANVDLASSFRNALRQRLAGLTIPVAPLRDRLEDIGPQTLLALEAAGIDHPQAPIAGALENPAIAAYWARVFFDFLHQPWAGNARELAQTAVQQLLLSDEALEYSATASAWSVQASEEDLEAVYEASGFEPAETARRLGISRPSLYRKIDAHPRCRIATQVTDAELDAAVAEYGPDPTELSLRLKVSARGLIGRLRQRGYNPD